MNIYDFESELKAKLEDDTFCKHFREAKEEFALAAEIIDLRSKAGLTQKQLAEKIGTSQPVIARLESGNYKNVSFSLIRRIADALGGIAEIHIRPR